MGTHALPLCCWPAGHEQLGYWPTSSPLEQLGATTCAVAWHCDDPEEFDTVIVNRTGDCEADNGADCCGLDGALMTFPALSATETLVVSPLIEYESVERFPLVTGEEALREHVGTGGGGADTYTGNEAVMVAAPLQVRWYVVDSVG